MPRYVTDETLSSVPALQGLTEDERAAVVDHASAVYAQVRANEWVTDGDLRTWGEQQEIGPDDMTAALAFLAQTGKLAQVPDTIPGDDSPGAPE